MTFAAFGLLAPLIGALVQEAIDVISILNALRALTGPTPGQVGPKLPPELSERLEAEHLVLRPRLAVIRDTADVLDTLEPAAAMETLHRVEALLVDEVLPHEAADENEIYPQMARILPGEDPMATMSRAHREIFHLVDIFRREVADLPPTGPDPADTRDLQRILYGLHAILRLHFDQEEELYTALRVG
jgi:hypothetical protein